MKELIIWYYQLPINQLEQIKDMFYTRLGDRYIYIIAVGPEKNTVFFHLLQFLQFSTRQKLLLSKDQTTTVLFEGKHYYVLESLDPLHVPIDLKTLEIPVIYPEPFPIASHFKERWLNKNRLHEEQLSAALDLLDNNRKTVLFDLATFYIHLNEQAYTYINELGELPFSISLCHVRLTPDTLKYECFSPEYLVLDNKCRSYCEYLRHLYLDMEDLDAVSQAISTINQVSPLTAQEWAFLYTRLFFPTHFYDTLHSIRSSEMVDFSRLYEQAASYTKLLYQVPFEAYHQNNISLRVPEWIRDEIFN